MSRNPLIDMAKDGLAHARAGTIAKADSVFRVPARNYYDPQRWQQEMQGIFSRLPLMLATSAELREPGDYKAMEAAGVPLFITRDPEGEIRAYLNSCAHRGAQVVGEGHGNATRFTCPYHAWSYNHRGDLTHIYKPDDFGELDKTAYGLVRLRAEERAGLIWVLTDPHSSLDIDSFLAGYDSLLARFGFGDWHYFDSRRVEGPNWKIAYDGYLDFYHLPILHRETFGADTACEALYYSWGPHQHVKSPQTTLEHLGALPEAEWPDALLLSGVWTIFPHVSIASFGEEGDARGALVSQLFPGETPGTSYTIQNYLMASAPDEHQAAAAREQFEVLRYVVEQEDYATGIRQQKALLSGARDHMLFGQNEAGGQNFHRWLEKILATGDDGLNALFRTSECLNRDRWE